MTETLELQIRPGMSEATDPRVLPLAQGSAGGVVVTPRLLQNVRFRQLQRIEKRPGAASLGTDGLPTVGTACFAGASNGRAVAGILETQTTGREDCGVYVHNGASRWSYLGRVSACVPHRRWTVAGRELTTMHTCMSVVAANGLLYATLVDPGGGSNRIFLLELTPEGQALRALEHVGDAVPRLVWTGATMYYVANNGGTVEARELNLTTFVLGSAYQFATAAAGSSTLVDAAPLEGSTDWLCCYATSATNLKVIRLAGTTESLAANITTTSAPQHYSICGKLLQSVLVLYGDGADAQATIFNSSLGAPSEITIATEGADDTWLGQFVAVRTDTDEFAVLLGGFVTTTTPALTTPFTEYYLVDTAGSSSAQARLQHFYPMTKPVRVGADGDCQVYCWCSNGLDEWDDVDVAQARHVLVHFEPTGSGGGAQLASVLHEHVARIPTGTTLTGSMADLGDGRFAAMLNWGDPGKFTGVDCAVFSLAGPSTSMAMAHRFTEQAGGALFISGGALTDIADAPAEDPDTYLAAENGFAHAPLVMLDLDTGGSLVADRAVTYVACFRRIDGRGRVQRSAASAPVSITPTGTDLTVDVYVTTLGVSNRWGLPGESVVAEVYRSELGGPYYYVGATGSVAPSGATVTISDGNAPDSIIDDDGALDVEAIQPEPPSGARLMCVWGPRLAVVGWNENEVQLSKYFRPDTSYEFTKSSVFRVPVADRITALGWMDGVGIIFSARKIQIVTGEGPDDRGFGGTFGQARELPTAVGADSPHVAEVPQGLLFKGAGTIWLLPRGFGPPQPVGDDIQETLASFPYLRSVCRCSNADDDVTHFVLAATDLPAAETKVAVWDNRLGGWALDDIAGEVGAAAAVDGAFTWLLPTWDAAADIPARKFSTAQFQDYSANGASTWIESRTTLGDMRAFGVIGWGNVEKIAMLGEVAGAHTLSLTVTTDEKSPYTATKAMTTLGQFYMEHGIQYPQGCAQTFSVFDAEHSAGRTAGLVLNTLALEVKKTPGLRRVAAGDAERM